MPNTMPPIPLKSPVTDKTGFISPAWAGFIVELFKRIGGTVALTNIELNSSASTIQTTINTHTNQIASLQARDNDFGQGTVL